jgi:hypothetical protein
MNDKHLDNTPPSEKRPSEDGAGALRMGQHQTDSAPHTAGVPFTPAPEAPDPFAPERLRIDPAGIGAAAEKVLVKIAVRKPNRQEFFRTRAGQEHQLTCAVVELKDEREIYPVAPEIFHLIAQETRLVTIRLCVNVGGVPFLWAVPAPTPDGRKNAWHETAREAAEMAETNWIRMMADMGAGMYSIYRGNAQLAEPSFPDKSLRDLLSLAFKDDGLIETLDHPVLKRLRGEN